MTDAYKCDMGGEYHEGKPAFTGEQANTVTSPDGTRVGEYELCNDCWGKVRKFIENPGDHSDEQVLDAEHHNAPKDGNDDPVGITEGDGDE